MVLQSIENQITDQSSYPILDKWVYEHQVMMDFSRPGKAADNASIKPFGGRLRNECLNTHGF